MISVLTARRLKNFDSKRNREIGPGSFLHVMISGPKPQVSEEIRTFTVHSKARVMGPYEYKITLVNLVLGLLRPTILLLKILFCPDE